MAKFTYEIPRALQKQLEAAGDLDEIAPRMLRAGAAPLEAALRKKLAPHRDTGALAGSVKAEKPRRARGGGWFLRVGFAGYGEHRYPGKTQRVPNALKALNLEYGNSRQQPRPFLGAAVRESEAEAVEAMQRVYAVHLAEKELRG